MLFSAYMYALYQNKNRTTPLEFFNDLKAKALGASSNANNTTPSPKEVKEAEALSWDNPEDRPYIVAIFIVIFFEFVLLYFAILMAIRVSKTSTQLFLNLFGAIFFTLPYILLNTIFQTNAYLSLSEEGSMRSRSFSGRIGSSRYV